MEPIIGEWKTVDLCCSCGTVLSECATASHWGNPCHHCGAVGTYCPNTFTTARRFITTKKVWFGKDKGYWEWSGKTADGGTISGVCADGRTIANPVNTIVASGIASGLF